ncbi:MAG: S8 family serine peptidase [Phormidium sp. BM_Day4_Bin.17]|nr:S8 family serine peptidase [Phormidium sp. BM_Day4_Bin.17]UCJ13634.1 MAG: S8 family serine peptidase [Phormidium sp. PBR-2020]
MSPFNPRSWFNRRFRQDSPEAKTPEDCDQTFILEPIYTPGGLMDAGDDSDGFDLDPIDDPSDALMPEDDGDFPMDDGETMGDDGEADVDEGETDLDENDGVSDVGDDIDIDDEYVPDENIGETIPYAEEDEDLSQIKDSVEDGENSLDGDSDIPEDEGGMNDEELTDDESPDSEDDPEDDDGHEEIENELEDNPKDDDGHEEIENELEDNPKDDTENLGENENDSDSEENTTDSENDDAENEESENDDSEYDDEDDSDEETEEDEEDEDENPLAFDVPEFNRGVFQVGDSGDVGVDFLFDGGRYQGEVAFFSLAGFDEMEFDSIEDFIATAAQRAASGSEQGHIVISVQDEGARFTGSLFGEPDWNSGPYQGVKTFNMTPGDEFGVMLVPDGRVSEVLENPSIGGAKRPLFSLATANPNDKFHLGQIADLTGDGNTFVFEDQRFERSDRDYDDVIFQIRGAVGDAVHVSDVIDPELDWRQDDMGKALLAYADPYLTTSEQQDLAELAAELDGGPDGDEVSGPSDSTRPDSEAEELEVGETDAEMDSDEGEADEDDGDEAQTEVDNSESDDIAEVSGSTGSTESGNSSSQESSSSATGNATGTEPQESSSDSDVNALDSSEMVTETGTETEEAEGSDGSAEVSEPQDESGSQDSVADSELDSTSEETDSAESDRPPVATPPRFEFPKQDQPLVGIIDTGFAQDNPDLDYDNFILGRDLVDGDDNPLLAPGEGNEHGTHLLGLIAAQQDNDIGIDGINPDAPIWLGRAVGSGDWASSLVEFVDAAQEAGQPNAVVNLSLDLTEIDAEGNVTPRYELTVQERTALEYARQQGVLVVAAAGNQGGTLSGLAQAAREFDNVLTVGAAEEFDPNVAVAQGHDRADYSNFGAGLGLVAPGGTAENPVVSTVGDDLGTLAGTSVATARVTGATSLVWAANPELSYRQVMEILQTTATDLGTPNWNAETGAGLLNLVAAVHLAKATKPQAYDPTPIEIGENPRWRYIVRPGETPAGIAEEQLGDEAAWSEIRDSEGNPVLGPDEVLTPGTVVDLPVYRGGSVNREVESPLREPQPLTPANQAPEDLQLSLSRLYNPGETIRVSGWVSDADGADDLERVELWLRQDGGDWLEIEDVTEFAIDPKYPEWAGFDHKLSGLMPGQYELRAIPFDQAGKAGAGVGHEFTVLSVSEEQHLSERVKRAITQAMNLDAYHPDILALTEQWVVSVRHGESPEALAQQLGGTVLEPTGHIPNTYVWKFDGDTDTYDIAAAMKQVSGIEFAYPLVDLPIDLHSTPWHLQNTGQTGGQPGVDARVNLAWENHGVSGQGATIGVLDTGFDYNHPNLRNNYQAHLSYDFDEDNDDPSYILSVTSGSSDSTFIEPGETIELDMDDDARLRNGSFSGYISNLVLNLTGVRISEESRIEDVEISLISPSRQEFLLSDLETGDKSYSTDLFNGESPNILSPDEPWRLKVTNNNPHVIILERDASIDFELVNTHGTQVAGAAIANSAENEMGVAPGADWAGLRLGSDGFTELEISKALSHEKQAIDIYNNSWGTTFRSLALPGAVWTLENGVNTGRNGLGNAFVFSGGNSRLQHDNVNYNTLANSRYTLAVGAVDHVGNRAVYSTPGAPLFLSAPSANTHTLSYTGKSQAIPDDGSVLSVELGQFSGVSGSELINELQVQLGINHAQYDDLEVSLVRVGEDGTETRARLFSDVPFEQPYRFPGIKADGSISFADASPRDLPNHSTLFQGRFRPEESLDIFTQQEASGTWSVEVRDLNQNNLDGSLTSAAVFLNTPGIATTDLQGEAGVSLGNWTNQFGGTSAAAPIVSGVIALMLEVNPDLSWRDIQHILVETANREAIHDENADWSGSPEDAIRHSHQYGFGMVDADAAVAAAKNWVPVKPDTSLTVTDRPHIQNSRIRKNDPEGVSSSIEIEEDLSVEWVEVDFQGNHPNPNDLTLELVHTFTTPEGEEKTTVSTLASPYKPTGNHEYDDWWFTSVRHWGETSQGTWTLRVVDEGGNSSSLDNRDGIWDGWALTLHGTEPPQESKYPKPGYVNDRVGSLDLNMRQDPSTDSPVIGVLEKGDNLTILEPVTGKSYEIPPYEGEFRSDWYKVKVGDKIAYVAAYYVSEGTVYSDQPWIRQLGSAYMDRGNGVAVDADGNVYVAGVTNGSLDGNVNASGVNAERADPFITKYDAEGTRLWTRQMGTTGFDYYNDVIIADDGAIYTLGYADGPGTAGNGDGHLSKWDSNGNKIWKKFIGDADHHEFLHSLTADQYGNVYVAGFKEILGDNNSSNGLVIKYDSDGQQIWTNKIDSGTADRAREIKLDSQGNVYVLGRTEGSLSGNSNSGGSDVFLIKYDSHGNHVWTEQLEAKVEESPGKYNSHRMGLVIDEHDNIYISGYTDGEFPGQTHSGGSDTFVARYNTEGSLVWLRQLGTEEDEVESGLVIDSDGNLNLIGRTRELWGDETQSGKHNYDVYITKLDPDGNLLSTHFLGTDRDDAVRGITSDRNGNIYISGFTWGAFEGEKAGHTDFWVAKNPTKLSESYNWDRNYLGGNFHTEPYGDEFQVNTYTHSNQRDSSVTDLSDGGFVVTWQSSLQDGSGTGVYGQRYDSNGNPVGSEFQVNTYTDGRQRYSSVTGLAEGGFVVTWNSEGQDGSENSIYGQRYNNNGEPVGSEFQVNTYTDNRQWRSSVTGLADGGFVVTWQSDSPDGFGSNVYGQRYDSNGNPVDSEFQVNTHTHASQWEPSVTGLSDGGFVVTWNSAFQDGPGISVYGQRYNSNGNPVGSEFQVNTYTDNAQHSSSVTNLSDGGFVVTWQSHGQDGSGYGVYGQRYDSNGNPLGSEFQVNTYTDNRQWQPSVTNLSDGGFVVTWMSDGQDGSGIGVYGQRYDSNGNPVGAEFPVNPYLDGSQYSPSVTGLSDGRFVVTWHSNHHSDIYAKIFSTDGIATNTPPTTPTNLNSEISEDTATLTWDAATDEETPQSDLTYNLRVGTTPGGSDVLDDTREGGAIGNVAGNTNWTLEDLDPGTYYWSVQTVDSGFETSDPASEQSFTVEPSTTIEEPVFKIGDEFQVNTYTDRFQWLPSVTGLSDEGFVVTWESEGQDGSEGSGSIHGQRYDSNGNAVGSEFQVNTYNNDNHWRPSVTDLTDGGFVVTWESSGSQGGIYGQRYDSKGSAVGSEFQVINTYDYNNQRNPSVTGLSDRGFVVTWENYDADGPRGNIYGQRYDSNSNAVGSEFQVNTYTDDWQRRPSVADLSDGGFVVTWTSKGQDGSGDGIYGQRYDSNGNTVGSEFQVNTYTDDLQLRQSVTGLSDGGFVVTWESWGQDGSESSVYGQRYDSNGNSVGSEFQINTYTDDWQVGPSVTDLPDGGFVVTWTSNGQDGSGRGVFGQRYNSNGNAIGSEFQVNTYTEGNQRFSSVAGLANGRFVVTWQSDGQDGSGYGVFGQIFGTDGTDGTVEDSINLTEIYFAEDLHTEGNNIRMEDYPKTNQARAEFLADLVNLQTVDFEEFENNSRPQVLDFGGTTATLSYAGDLMVETLVEGTNGGMFPTSGANYLMSRDDTEFTIEFSEPQSAFGLNITDAEGSPFSMTLHREDGTTKNVVIPVEANYIEFSGSVLFFGVKDTETPFNAVTIHKPEKTERIGVDELVIGEIKS